MFYSQIRSWIDSRQINSPFQVRIVSDVNSMPRRTKCDSSKTMSGNEVICEGSRDTFNKVTKEKANFQQSNINGSVIKNSEAFINDSDSNGEQPISAKTFLDKLLSSKTNNYYSTPLPPSPPPPSPPPCRRGRPGSCLSGRGG